MTRCVLVALVAMIRSTPAVVITHDSAHSLTTVAQWAPFSITLNATGDARHVANPFTALELTVVWTAPKELPSTHASQQHEHGDVRTDSIDAQPIGVRSARGFWDGDFTWRVATFFPTTGMWTWRTEVGSPQIERKSLLLFLMNLFLSIIFVSLSISQ